MSLTDYWNIALAVITSLGGGALLVVGCATWLGKVWASRILESDRARYQRDIESLKEIVAKRVHEFSVAASRIDSQRSEAIRILYGALMDWFEVAIAIMAPNARLHEHTGEATSKYLEWGGLLHEKAEQIEILSMRNAIFFSEESYAILAKCVLAVSDLSTNFASAADAVGRYRGFATWAEALKPIMDARSRMQAEVNRDFTPAREMLIREFRALMHPPPAT